VNTLPPEVAMLVDAAGGVPRQYDSELQHRRYHHTDLMDLHDEELEAERALVILAWSALLRWRYGGCNQELAWFTQRRAAILAEVERRQRRR
jgi:hypothetical protein